MAKINPTQPYQILKPPEVPKPASQAAPRTFEETLSGFLRNVNELQHDASTHVEKLLTGEIKDVHDVMVAVEKAGTSFELMMEIRNKMIDAYREVMRMQV